MAYPKKDDRPRKQKKIGSLWKPKEQGAKHQLEGWLDLGIDAGLKIQITKAETKKSDKSPDYYVTVSVVDWESGRGQTAPSPQAHGADDDVPF